MQALLVPTAWQFENVRKIGKRLNCSLEWNAPNVPRIISDWKTTMFMRIQGALIYGLYIMVYYLWFIYGL